MYYFNFIPNELFEIIISQLDYDDFISFSKIFDITNLNYSLIYYNKFNNKKIIDYRGYKKYLGIQDFGNKLGLKQSLEKDKNLPSTGKRLTYFHQNLTELGELTSLNIIYTGSNLSNSLSHLVGDIIYLGTNKLTSLPESIRELTQLENLMLSNNSLTSLPDSIGELTQLKTLYLNGNKLTSLPDTIGNLINLKFLVLSGNELTIYPKSLDKLINTKIIK